MMDTKWTPGEWKSYECENISYWPGLDAGNFSVIIWGDKDTNLGVQGNTLDEARANARLIAAAPDLCEALQAMVDYCNAECGSKIYPGHQANQALAKARGETQ